MSERIELLNIGETQKKSPRNPYVVPAKHRVGAGVMCDRRASRGGAHNELQEGLKIWEEETKGADKNNSGPALSISKAPEKTDSNAS